MSDLTDEELFAILKSIDPETVRLPIGFKQFAHAVIAAWNTRTAPALPVTPCECWKLVPIEPTEAMLKAAFHNYHKTHIYDAQRPYQAHASTYAAILAAAPSPEAKP